MPRLYIERGPDRGKELVLRAGQQIVVGRDAGANLPLTDPMCSRRHIGIGESKGAWFIKDLGSNNGSFLNGKPIETDKVLRIEVGASINIGDTLISFLPSSADGAADPLCGVQLGGYKIEKRLGRGAMGVVYQAHQVSLGRDVALKVLSADVADDEKFSAMFKKEAQAAATLNHQNILQVYDVAQADGKLFIAMELATGGSVLDELRSSGTIPLDRSISIVRDALGALEYAEKKGLVHRDIKPDNLMITGDGVVKLGDLGLAARATELSNVQSGVFGTPHYIAPEQAQGKPVDHRADLYALGASWYRMLSGNTLFQGSSVREILKAQVRDRHIPLREVVHDIPPAISAIVDRMLEKEPDQRYQSATHVLDDIQAYLSNRSFNPSAMGGYAAPQMPQPMAGSFDGQGVVYAGKKSLPWGMIIGGVVVLVAVVAGGVFLFGELGKKPNDNNAVTVVDPNANGTTVRQNTPRPKGKQSSPDAATRLGRAMGLEDAGKHADALTLYEEVAKHYAEFIEAETAATKIAELKALLERKASVVGELRDRWAAIEKSARESLIPSFRIEELAKAVAEFNSSIDALATAETVELKAELATDARLVDFRSAVDKGFSAAITEAEKPLGAIPNMPIEQRPDAVSDVVAALRALVDATDSEPLKARGKERIKLAEETLSAARLTLVEHRRQIRVKAASESTKAFMVVAQKISNASAAFNYREAAILLEEFVSKDKGLAEYGELDEYRELSTMIADRRDQTAMHDDALWWLSRNWFTKTPPGFFEIGDNALLQSMFPGAAKVRVDKLIPGRDDKREELPSARFRYVTLDAKNTSSEPAVMDWNTVSPATAGVFIKWVISCQDPTDPTSILNQLKEPTNARLRLGLGSVLLEAGATELALQLIEGAYNLTIGQPKSDETRRTREYMAYALTAHAKTLALAGEADRARRLLDRVAKATEFEGTRARGLGSSTNGN